MPKCAKCGKEWKCKEWCSQLSFRDGCFCIDCMKIKGFSSEQVQMILKMCHYDYEKMFEHIKPRLVAENL